MGRPLWTLLRASRRLTEGTMSSLDYQQRRDARILWVIELVAFVLIIGIGAVGYTVAS